jgi:hypothetical protein
MWGETKPALKKKIICHHDLTAISFSETFVFFSDVEVKKGNVDLRLFALFTFQLIVVSE